MRCGESSLYGREEIAVTGGLFAGSILKAPVLLSLPVARHQFRGHFKTMTPETALGQAADCGKA